MNAIALVLSALLCSQAGQDSEADRLRKELEKVKADNVVAMRQLEVALAQLRELNDKLAKKNAAAEAPPVGQLTKEYKALAEKTAEMARDKEKYTAPAPAPATPAPRLYTHFTVPESKITAVASEIGLVVLSIGKDDGVVEGQTYTITRGGESIATVIVDRADRKWAAGKMTKKTSEPRVGDAVVAEQAVAKTPPTGLARTSADELKIIRKELDDVRLEVRKLSDRIVPLWQGQGVSVEEAPEELRAHLSILRGLLVRRLREGSPAEKAGLQVNDVVPDLLEAQLVQAIESGMPIHVIRQGQRVRLPGAMGK
jgi:hypothetical protein